MGWTIVRHDDAESFLRRAGSWLAEGEAENNLILGIAERLEAGDHGFGSPVYLATVETEGRVEGCAWRTPPHKAGLTRMPPEAAPAVAADMAQIFDAIPAVMAEERVADAFARAWSAARGVRVRAGMRMRIHSLEAVSHPARPTPGALRAATAPDRDLLGAWWDAFAEEARVAEREPGIGPVARRISRGDLYLWEDGDPVCLVGISGRSPRGVRIGPVYTPPERRGRGYATAAVAEVTRRQLDAGRALCFLYTDLANPTSNSIYAAIGYRPVCDVVEVHFEERGR